MNPCSSHPRCLRVNCIYELWNSELWNSRIMEWIRWIWEVPEVSYNGYCSVYSDPLFRANAPNPQLLGISYTARPQLCPSRVIPLGTVDCFVQVSTPFPGNIPQLTTGYWEDTKTQFPCFNLGQLQRSLSELFKLHRARCQLQSHYRSAAPSAQSCLPGFLTRVPPRTLLNKPSTSSSLFESLSPENPI